MDFKNQIQNKYQKEVDPVFNETNWQSFLAHGKKKKRRPFLILWFSIGIAVISTMIWHPIQNLLFENKVSHLQSAPPGTLAQSLNSPEINTELKTNPTSKTDNTQEPTLEKSNLLSNNNVQNKKVQLNILATNSSTTYQLDHQLPSAVSKNAMPGEVATENAEVLKTDHLAGLIRSRHLPLLACPAYVLEEQFPFSVKDPNKHWNKSTYAVQVYGGLSHPFHVQTVEEKAFQFGGKIYQLLGKKLRLKSGIELGNISFVSKIMNPHLGVDLVEAPSDIVQFDHAIVESVNLNIEFGVDRLIYSKNAWQSYVGISYLLATEITKDIDYTFAGMDDFSTNDDILVSKKDATKYFVPHILKVETGLHYQSSIGGINLSLAFPYQIAKTNVELLQQLQINVGFTHKL